MSERFIKFIPSEEAFWLMHNKEKAFRLLSHIAKTARRKNGNPDGLLIGQCHLQHWTHYDLTESEYRTAKKILVTRKHIIIIETNRTRKKSTTGSTTNSTLVQICSTTIYDINPESNDDRIDGRMTTERRPNDDKQERIRMNKNINNKLPLTPSFEVSAKIKFRQFVELTQDQHDSLLAKHGLEFFKKMLDVLDAYKGSTGKTYASDFHTMKDGGWVVERVKKELLTQKSNHERTQQPIESSNQPQKFQGSRVLRGSNNEFQANKQSIHE